MYEQDRRDTDMGRDSEEKTAPRRRYEAGRRAAADAVEDFGEDGSSPRRRHRYAEEPAAPDREAVVAEMAMAASDQVEAGREELMRIASFFRGARETREEQPFEPPRPVPDRSPDADSVWATRETQEIRTPIPAPRSGVDDRTGEGDSPGDEAVLLAVRELPGVHDADLYTDAAGHRRLRLDLDSAADPDAVSAQAARILADRLGVRAQPRTTQQFAMPRPVPGQVSRAVVEQVQVSTSGYEASVEVALVVDGRRAVGRATGPAVDWHVLRTAADAAIDAVSGLLTEKGRCVVEHAAVVPAGALRVAVVVVLLLTEAGAEQLAGAAPVSGDSRQAMVHATMSALNRRLEVLLP